MIGTRLAHYEITSHLGSGAMGEVYQATDTKLGRSVAVKFFRNPSLTMRIVLRALSAKPVFLRR